MTGLVRNQKETFSAVPVAMYWIQVIETYLAALVIVPVVILAFNYIEHH
jgi:hypothetical protein